MNLDNYDHYTIDTYPTISVPHDPIGYVVPEQYITSAVPSSWEYGSNPPCKCGYTGGHYRTTHLARMLLLRYGWERRSSF